MQLPAEGVPSRESLVTSSSAEVFKALGGISVVIDTHPAFFSQTVSDFLGDLGDQDIPLQTYRTEDATTGNLSLSDQDGKSLGLKELSKDGTPGAVLVVSTCVSPKWQDGTFPSELLKLGEERNVAVISLFGADSTGRRTAIAEGFDGALVVREDDTSILTNNSGIVTAPPRSRKLQRLGAAPIIPIISLDTDYASLDRYTKAISGQSDESVLVAHFDPDHMAEAYAQRQQEGELQTAPDPMEQVLQFRSCVSPRVYSLAIRLAAAPLDQGTVKHFLETLYYTQEHPTYTERDFAEIGFSGLMEIIQHKDSNLMSYDFVKDVREILLTGNRRSEVYELLDSTTDFLVSRDPDYATTFTNLHFGNPNDLELNERTIGFARVCSQIWPYFIRTSAAAQSLKEQIAAYDQSRRVPKES